MPKRCPVAIIAMGSEEGASFDCHVFEMAIIERGPTGGVFLSDGDFNVAWLPEWFEGKAAGVNHLGFQEEEAAVIGDRFIGDR